MTKYLRYSIRSGIIIAIAIAIIVAIYIKNQSLAVSWQNPTLGQQAPAFTHTNARDWFNSPVLTLNELKGKVTLIDFWTFGCWNCYRSFPWLNSVEKKFKDDPFIVLGVHSPEFENEKNYTSIAEKIEEFKLHHPVMVDNDMSYWRAMRNRYWPAFYLLDKTGKVRSIFVGETHIGDKQATQIEAQIAKLLQEG